MPWSAPGGPEVGPSLTAAARGDRAFVALPVFPSRVFRHGYIYVNRRSGIRTPKDLEGKRVGTALYTQTAAVWVRGHLADQYGVDLSTIRWVQGAVEKGGAHGDPNAPPLLKPAAIEVNLSGRSLSELLATHGIDAIAAADGAPFRRGAAVCRRKGGRARLFPRHRHLSDQIRRGVYEANPWIASSVLD